MKQSYNSSSLFSTPDTSSSSIGTGKVEADFRKPTRGPEYPVRDGWLPPYNSTPRVPEPTHGVSDLF